MKIKINIIGLGIMGKSIGNVLARNRDVTITACASLKEEDCEVARSQFDFERSYQDYEKMMAAEKPDAVYIATPDWAHFEPVMAALESGIHVHVEKPMTTSEPQAAAIVKKVRETGLKLQVSYNHRWLAPYNATFNMIREGQVGQCLMGYARKSNPITVPTQMIPWAEDSSPMWFLSSHDIDLMSWWFDDDPVEVKCFGVKQVLKQKLGWDTYDALQGLVRYSRGGFATFESAWIYAENHPAMPDSFMEVVGECGHVHLDRKTEAVEISTQDGLKWPRTLLNYQVFDRWVGAFPSCINSFIDDLIDDREPIVTAFDGWRSTAALDALHRSADSGQTITVATAPER